LRFIRFILILKQEGSRPRSISEVCADRQTSNLCRRNILWLKTKYGFNHHFRTYKVADSMNKISSFFAYLGVTMMVFPTIHTDDSADSFLNSLPDSTYLEGLNECTTGLALGVATPDGRPLLWKNRDVGNARQEFHYFDDGRIPFISITYSGELEQNYGGVNAAGFALENSNSYNLSNGPYQNGFGYGDDDGHIHTLALATCRTVDDFQRLLDSTNVAGRTLNCNYGAIDAFGNAAMFETAGYRYTRCDAATAPDGFLVRSNYSYSGQIGNVRSSSWGPHRHDAAYTRFRWAVERNLLTPLYVYQSVIRDISVDGLDPYPLPFNGYFGNYSFGCIPNGEAVCRATTRGILVVQGVASGGRPEDAILWANAGSMLTSVATPLWVRAGRVPVEYDGPDAPEPSGSRINRRSVALLSNVYDARNFGTVVDTWKLTNPAGTGLWDYILPLERRIYEKTMRFVQSPQFSYDRLAAFQAEIAQQAADSLDAWRPTYTMTELTSPLFNGRRLLLRWGEVAGFVGGHGPEHFRIYRSTLPFRDGDQGTMIAEVDGQSWEDASPPNGAAYYRVEGAY